MSQTEQRIRAILGRYPEIEKCEALGLLNHRALARFVIAQGAATRRQLDAVVATLRRSQEWRAPAETVPDLFPKVRIGLKDQILILDFAKDKALLPKVERLVTKIDYDQGDTLKLVVGTASIKLIIDERRESAVRQLFDQFKPRQRFEGITEISMMFPDEATETKGILAVLAREFLLNDITITELLTTSPELLVYLRDPFVPKAYEVVRGLQRTSARETHA